MSGMSMIRNSIINELKIKIMELDHGKLSDNGSYRDGLLVIAATAIKELERIDRDTLKSNKV